MVKNLAKTWPHPGTDLLEKNNRKSSHLYCIFYITLTWKSVTLHISRLISLQWNNKLFWPLRLSHCFKCLILFLDDKDVLQFFLSLLLSHSEPTRRGTLSFDCKIPGCCLSSSCIMLYSTAAYLNISQPAAWCVRLIVVTPTTSNGLERTMLWYKTSSSCLFIEESTSLWVLNMTLYLQYRLSLCWREDALSCTTVRYAGSFCFLWLHL